MTSIFADAFYFIALLNPADHHHDAAVAASEDLSEPLVTGHRKGEKAVNVTTEATFSGGDGFPRAQPRRGPESAFPLQIWWLSTFHPNLNKC